MRAALAVRDLPGLLSSGSYQPAKSNLSLGIGTEQFLPSTRTFQKFSSPSPVNKNIGLNNVTAVLKMAPLATSYSSLYDAVWNYIIQHKLFVKLDFVKF